MADARTSHKSIPDLPKLPFVERHAGKAHTEQHVHSWVSDRKLRTGKVHFNELRLFAAKKESEGAEGIPGEIRAFEARNVRLPSQVRREGQGRAPRAVSARGGAGLRLSTPHPWRCRLDPSGRSCHGRTPPDRVGKPGVPDRRRQAHVFVPAVSQRQRRGRRRLLRFLRHPSQYPALSQPPTTPKPRIYGIQTAKVVGKKGEESEEISTDEHGRIWVQFHWDREPQKSCPVRVAQTWAGKQWGAIFIPRIGMEVVVDFLEGDPDARLSRAASTTATTSRHTICRPTRP